MLRLSINLLSNMLGFLNETKSYDRMILPEEFVPYRAFSVSMDSMLEMARKCKWLTYLEGRATLTARGQQIVELPQYGLSEQKLRLMLSDYIAEIQPIWRNRIPYGRKEATIFMTKDEKACFYEAGLLGDSLSQDVIEWWDFQAATVRKDIDSNKLSIGRKGEQLSLRYEELRTNTIPQWLSVESNLIGYDIISQESETDTKKRLIEVKASTEQISCAFFHLSQNEWSVAMHSDSYKFYIWQIGSNNNKLAILAPSDLIEYIPINQGSGEWESVKIPYESFSEFFSDIIF